MKQPTSYFCNISAFCRPAVDGDDENRLKHLRTNKDCLQETKNPLCFRFYWKHRGFIRFSQYRLTKKETAFRLSLWWAKRLELCYHCKATKKEYPHRGNFLLS